MDAGTFAKELAKYKTVRKADFYEIKFKKDRNRSKLSSVSSKPSPAPVLAVAPAPSSGKKELTDADFWTLIANTPNKGGLSNSDWNKFINAMRDSHSSMLQIMNLEDLEYLAAPQKL